MAVEAEEVATGVTQLASLPLILSPSPQHRGDRGAVRPSGGSSAPVSYEGDTPPRPVSSSLSRPVCSVCSFLSH